MWKIILIIIFTLFFIFYQKKQEVIFLDKENGEKLFESNHFKEIQKTFQEKEVYYLSNKKIFNGDKDAVKQLFIESIIIPSTEQKKLLNKMCEKADKILIDLYGETIKWKIMSWNYGVLWDYFTTIEDVIIIPEEHLDIMEKTDGKSILAFLLHEAIHILQRYNLKNEFDDLYKEMGFERKNIENILMKNREIKENWVTNPDGFNGEWLYKVKDGYICPMVLLDSNGNHKSKYVNMDKNLKIVGDVKELSLCKEYEKFMGVNQAYHPNEIFGSYMHKYMEKFN